MQGELILESIDYCCVHMWLQLASVMYIVLNVFDWLNFDTIKICELLYLSESNYCTCDCISCHDITEILLKVVLNTITLT